MKGWSFPIMQLFYYQNLHVCNLRYEKKPSILAVKFHFSELGIIKPAGGLECELWVSA